MKGTVILFTPHTAGGLTKALGLCKNMDSALKLFKVSKARGHHRGLERHMDTQLRREGGGSHGEEVLRVDFEASHCRS